MKFYYSKKLTPFTNLTHAFTSRKSGNLAFHVGDDELSVEKNHILLANTLEYQKETLVHMKQIHSDLVCIVSDEKFNAPPTCDALITNRPNTPLMVMVADCSPVLFYDDEKKAIAAAHAGRAGAFKNIVKIVVDKMAKAFGSNPKDMQVSIGASIGVCCYEVGSEIYKEAKALHLEYAMQKRDDKFYLDVNKILKKQLIECGINEQNIEIFNECTSCNTHKYFSYRAEKQTGRFAGVLMIKDS
ncbi:MAG: peptidoglycan editing factor PgeF [Sulfurimonas sp.]|uniref:peptidoglycan editing factor PgeF n=1 Tax=Sulfurimonas sp. TaxID=2022749 RepID=UPI0026164C22|nr:peptidoglycan editing factor PgeF [Sulfurimonas sp.]MDD5399777.1 peptidoglycan editing factor PgeF [Sulfurimonas sp.]